MLEKQWNHLKSGTDVRGKAVAENPDEIELTDKAVGSIAAAFALWLSEKKKKTELTVAVGHDSRISAQRIKTAVCSALINCGVTVYDCGLSSTPAMFMTTVTGIKCDGSIQITASHHPYDKNGLKFFTCTGGLEGADIETLLQFAQDRRSLTNHCTGKVVTIDFMSVYSRILRDIVCKEVAAADFYHPLKGLKIIVDAGNGAGGFYVKEVLQPLGADCTGSQFLEPDGMFPNHIPNPENAAAMESARLATIRAKADLGIIFDTDVDRMGCVDQQGEEINRNRLIALASVIALEQEPGGTIVTDSLTSDGLRSFIENKLGAKQLRYQRGYKNVINKSIALNRQGVPSPLAIETSGHAALKENYFLDDGAYLATKIVIQLALLKKNGQTLERLIDGLEEPAESVELRFPILQEEFRPLGEQVLSNLKIFAAAQKNWFLEQENYEGVRVNFPTGWLLLRLSVHDPILPLNIETVKKGEAKKVMESLSTFFAQYDFLDLQQMNAYLSI